MRSKDCSNCGCKIVVSSLHPEGSYASGSCVSYCEFGKALAPCQIVGQAAGSQIEGTSRVSLNQGMLKTYPFPSLSPTPAGHRGWKSGDSSGEESYEAAQLSEQEKMRWTTVFDIRFALRHKLFCLCNPD